MHFRLSYSALILALLMAACGAPNLGQVKFRAPKIESQQARHQRAVRLAARGRVLYRSGLDGEAAETLRKSYDLEPDLQVLLDHAHAAERANWFEQAYAAWTEVLQHPIDAQLRERATSEAQRLKPLVPLHHASVMVHVSPPQARVVFISGEKERVVLSDGMIRLPAGDWQVMSSARGYRRELRALRVREGRELTVSVSLRRSKRSAGLSLEQPIKRAPEPKVVAATKTPPKKVRPEPADNAAAKKATAKPVTTAAASKSSTPTPPASDGPAEEGPGEEGDSVADNATEPVEEPVEEPAEPGPKPAAKAPANEEIESKEQPKPKPASKAADKDAEPQDGGEPAAEGDNANDAAGEPAGGPDSGNADSGAADDGLSAQPAPRPVSKFHRFGPWVVAGVGVLAVGVGGFLGSSAKQWADQANALAPTRADYKTQLQFYADGATSRALGATAAIIGGGVLAAAGTVWWVLAPKKSNRSAWLPSNVQVSDRQWSFIWTF